MVGSSVSAKVSPLLLCENPGGRAVDCYGVHILSLNMLCCCCLRARGTPGVLDKRACDCVQAAPSLVPRVRDGRAKACPTPSFKCQHSNPCHRSNGSEQPRRLPLTSAICHQCVPRSSPGLGHLPELTSIVEGHIQCCLVASEGLAALPLARHPVTWAIQAGIGLLQGRSDPRWS